MLMIIKDKSQTPFFKLLTFLSVEISICFGIPMILKLFSLCIYVLGIEQAGTIYRATIVDIWFKAKTVN